MNPIILGLVVIGTTLFMDFQRRQIAIVALIAVGLAAIVAGFLTEPDFKHPSPAVTCQ